MKTLKQMVMAWSHWLLADPRSERFFNWLLGIFAASFFAQLIIRFLIQNL